ncbi:MAG: hypothetical protein IIY23_02990, partial [Erysipelotrichaceae bacterium]|nr:hypothetical protein [Erysipelotrichaceae bacterium]
RLDFGGEERTIVSGLAKYYKPDELIGQNVCAVLNLAPRKLRGIESQGMLLTASRTNEKGEEEVKVLTSPLPAGSLIS